MDARRRPSKIFLFCRWFFFDPSVRCIKNKGPALAFVDDFFLDPSVRCHNKQRTSIGFGYKIPRSRQIMLNNPDQPLIDSLFSIQIKTHVYGTMILFAWIFPNITTYIKLFSSNMHARAFFSLQSTLIHVALATLKVCLYFHHHNLHVLDLPTSSSNVRGIKTSKQFF